MPIWMTDLLKNQSEQLKNDLNTIGAELNAFKIQLEQENHEKKEKSDGNREVSLNFARLENKISLLTQEVEASERGDMEISQEIADLKEKIKKLKLQQWLNVPWNSRFQPENPQTSVSFLEQQAEEGRKDAAKNIADIAQWEDENRIAATMQKRMRKLILDLMKKMVS